MNLCKSAAVMNLCKSAAVMNLGIYTEWKLW